MDIIGFYCNRLPLVSSGQLWYLSFVIPAEAGIQEAKMKQYYVYILCSERNGTLYTGITSDLLKRVYEHKNNLVEGFTQKYCIHRLVWYETHRSPENAILREKQIKAWKRQWKLRLIEENNPEWNDLYEIICEDTGFLPAQE